MIVEEPEQSFIKDGITEKNVMELVKVLTDRNFHVSLWRLSGFPSFHIKET